MQKNTADIYLCRPATRSLKLTVSIEAPRRWRDSTQYIASPRVQPD